MDTTLFATQTTKELVSVHDTTVEVVQVGGGKTTAFEGNEGAKVGRDDREDTHDHPLGTKHISNFQANLYSSILDGLQICDSGTALYHCPGPTSSGK